MTSHEPCRRAESVRKATAGEAGKLAAVLARAFYDDPQMRWVIKDDARRHDLLERGFALYLRKLWLEQDECYTTASAAGVCVWEKPGQWKAGILEPAAPAAVDGADLPRCSHESSAGSRSSSPTIRKSPITTCRSRASTPNGRAVGWAPH